MTTTTTHEIYRLDLRRDDHCVCEPEHDRPGDRPGGGQCADESGQPGHRSEGNIYIVEDRGGGVDNDIWFAKDLNQDGDLLDAGEGIGALGQQRYGGFGVHRLLHRPIHKRRAWVNIQHPGSEQRPTIEITMRVRVERR